MQMDFDNDQTQTHMLSMFTLLHMCNNKITHSPESYKPNPYQIYA